MNLLQRIELNFWRYFIPVIRESSTIQIVFPKMYPVVRHRIFLHYLVPASLCAALGLSIGILFGLAYSLW